MTEELEFFMYLLEYYAAYKSKSSGNVMQEWDKHGITQEIYDSYWIYHTEAIENAYKDIDCLLQTGRHAY